MLLSWIFGIILIYLNGLDVLSNLWMQIKLILVIILTGYHEYLGKCLISLKNKKNTKTSKFYRYINEVPTVLLILIVSKLNSHEHSRIKRKNFRTTY